MKNIKNVIKYKGNKCMYTYKWKNIKYKWKVKGSKAIGNRV